MPLLPELSAAPSKFVTVALSPSRDVGSFGIRRPGPKFDKVFDKVGDKVYLCAQQLGLMRTNARRLNCSISSRPREKRRTRRSRGCAGLFRVRCRVEEDSGRTADRASCLSER